MYCIWYHWLFGERGSAVHKMGKVPQNDTQQNGLTNGNRKHGESSKIAQNCQLVHTHTRAMVSAPEFPAQNAPHTPTARVRERSHFTIHPACRSSLSLRLIWKRARKLSSAKAPSLPLLPPTGWQWSTPVENIAQWLLCKCCSFAYSFALVDSGGHGPGRLSFAFSVHSSIRFFAKVWSFCAVLFCCCCCYCCSWGVLCFFVLLLRPIQVAL